MERSIEETKVIQYTGETVRLKLFEYLFWTQNKAAYCL